MPALWSCGSCRHWSSVRAVSTLLLFLKQRRHLNDLITSEKHRQTDEGHHGGQSPDNFKLCMGQPSDPILSSHNRKPRIQRRKQGCQISAINQQKAERVCQIRKRKLQQETNERRENKPQLLFGKVLQRRHLDRESEGGQRQMLVQETADAKRRRPRCEVICKEVGQ